MIKLSDYSPRANDNRKHDNKNGPCKCGAWHSPEEFELECQHERPTLIDFNRLSNFWKCKHCGINLSEDE